MLLYVFIQKFIKSFIAFFFIDDIALSVRSAGNCYENVFGAASGSTLAGHLARDKIIRFTVNKQNGKRRFFQCVDC